MTQLVTPPAAHVHCWEHQSGLSPTEYRCRDPLCSAWRCQHREPEGSVPPDRRQCAMAAEGIQDYCPEHGIWAGGVQHHRQRSQRRPHGKHPTFAALRIEKQPDF